MSYARRPVIPRSPLSLAPFLDVCARQTLECATPFCILSVLHGDASTHRRATDLHARRQGELLQQGARCLANLSLNEANEAALVASNRADKLGPIMIAICAHEDVVREREC